MWRNYWTVAVRALAKNRTYSVINIAGLAIGMAACIMILLYINYERSYDKWLPDVENTYQLQAWYPHPQDGEPAFLQMSAIVSKEAAKKDFPQIAASVYALSSNPVFIKDGQASPTKEYLVADDDFLKVSIFRSCRVPAFPLPRPPSSAAPRRLIATAPIRFSGGL